MARWQANKVSATTHVDGDGDHRQRGKYSKEPRKLSTEEWIQEKARRKKRRCNVCIRHRLSDNQQIINIIEKRLNVKLNNNKYRIYTNKVIIVFLRALMTS